MNSECQKGYGIGAVVRRTGLTAPNIRMWEKRYSAVVPSRTESNRRLYSLEDVERLMLMKQLTKQGHAISNIAALSKKQLRDRLEGEKVSVSPKPGQNGEDFQFRVIEIGQSLSFKEESFVAANTVAKYETVESAHAEKKLPEADIIVIETDTLFPEAVAMIRNLVNRAGAIPGMLIYRFAATKTAAELALTIDGMSLFRAPVTERQLRRECLVKLGKGYLAASGLLVDTASPIPERLYTSQQLSRLSRLSTTVECECPQHLAGILQSLSAFEKYSSECEDRNPEDAILHTFLHRTTAAVRRAMEEALEHIVLTEGIELN